MKKNNLVIAGVAVFMLSSCGSSEDVDAVASDMMTGSDAVAEKDAKCLAKNIKKNATDDQWDLLVKKANGEIDESDYTIEQAMGMMVPYLAAAAKCGVQLK